MTTRFRRLVMHSRIAALVTALAISAGCAADAPTTPTAAFGEGVTLYPDSLYRGERITLGGDVADLRRVRGPCGGDSESDSPSHFDDCVSSLRIPAGWTATVFRDRGFSGPSAIYTADVHDLDVVPGPCRPGFNDCVSSLRVTRQ
jgi:hypothetical protein